MIVQIEHMNNAIPIGWIAGIAVDADGFDEPAFDAMLGFNGALKLACVGVVHSGDLSGLRMIWSN